MFFLGRSSVISCSFLKRFPLIIRSSSSAVLHHSSSSPSSFLLTTRWQPQIESTTNLMMIRKFSNTSSGNDENKNDDQEDQDDQQPILLMNFLPRGMPNLFYSLKNLYIINFVLRAQIDKNFVWKDFIEGAKQALVTVSSLLADNRFDELESLVDAEALKEIRKNYEKLTLAQRRELRVQPSDIVLAFAHHIDIETFQESFTGSKKHIVNFFVVFDTIRGLEETLRARAQSQGSQVNPREIFREFAERKTICNYEFRREYIEGKGPASDWIVSKLLHIKEKDLIPVMRLLK